MESNQQLLVAPYKISDKFIQDFVSNPISRWTKRKANTTISSVQYSPDLMVCCLTSFHEGRVGRSTDRCLRGLSDWLFTEDSQWFTAASSCTAGGMTQLLATRLDDGTTTLWLDGVATDCRLDVYIRRTTNTTSSHAINTRCRSISWRHTHQTLVYMYQHLIHFNASFSFDSISSGVVQTTVLFSNTWTLFNHVFHRCVMSSLCLHHTVWSN